MRYTVCSMVLWYFADGERDETHGMKGPSAQRSTEESGIGPMD